MWDQALDPPACDASPQVASRWRLRAPPTEASQSDEAGIRSAMFRRRRATQVQAQSDERAVDREAGELIHGSASPDLPTARQGEVAAKERRTLDTMCGCGHTRRDHTGPRMEVDGRCLECGCEAFNPANERQDPSEEMIERMQAAIARVERIRALAEGLRVAQHPAGGGRRRPPPR